MIARFLGLSVLALVSITACSKPEPPKIVPKEARVTAITPAGIEVALKVEATNPNSVTLQAQSFTGKAKLDGKWELASVTIVKPVVLPPHAPTMIDVPLTMPWQDTTALVAMATAQKPIPYVVEGTVTVGGESMNVEVPYAVSGTVTREQLAAAAKKAMPQIPGLPLPGAPPHR